MPTSRNPLVDDVNRRVLQGLANGETQRSLAVRLGFSESALANRLYRVRAALGARTTPQAVAIALRRRYID